MKMYETEYWFIFASLNTWQCSVMCICSVHRVTYCMLKTFTTFMPLQKIELRLIEEEQKAKIYISIFHFFFNEICSRISWPFDAQGCCDRKANVGHGIILRWKLQHLTRSSFLFLFFCLFVFLSRHHADQIFWQESKCWTRHNFAMKATAPD